MAAVVVWLLLVFSLSPSICNAQTCPPPACHSDATCMSGTCECNPGYSGNGTSDCQDINECDAPATNNCDSNAVCANTPGNYTCTCRAGFTDINGDGSNCVDINECTASAPNQHNCDANADCVNTPGSFTCTCRAGFTDINGDGRNCVDINECTASAPNQHNCDANAVCANTPGSYTCTCRAGFTDINGDGRNCVDIDECATSSHDCDDNADCANTPAGSYTCTCRAGFTDTNGDGKTCTVCVEGQYGMNCESQCSCVQDATCNNVNGDCMCTKPANLPDAACDKNDLNVSLTLAGGHRVVMDTVNQDDITLTCNVNLLPVDLDGSGVRITYPDSTESAILTPNAQNPGLYELLLSDVHQTNAGQYMCTARTQPTTSIIVVTATYTLEVMDVNECADGSLNNCDVQATCTNTPGNFECECNTGYEGAGTTGTCLDVDECGDPPQHNCDGNASCMNTVGSFYCVCNAGFTGSGTNGDCTECMEGKYGFNCAEDCTCVAPIPGQNDVRCRNTDGFCTCDSTEFTGKNCDKRNLTVSLEPIPHPVLDTAANDSIVWRCTVNLHSRDLSAPVAITYPNGDSPSTTMTDEGVYEVTLDYVTPNDNGRYTCSASAGFQQVTDDFILDVLIVGRIIDVSPPTEGKEGDTVDISCTVYISPGATITWHLSSGGSDPITPNGKYAISQTTDGQYELTSTLSVSQLELADGRTYLCNATEDTRGVQIIFIEPPRIAGIALSTLSHDELRVTWRVTFLGNVASPSCTVKYRKMITGQWMAASNSPVTGEAHTITGLEPYTDYYVQVVCTNKVGPSNMLTDGPQRTLKTNPTEPQNLVSANIQPETFVVTWGEPAMKYGPIDFYRISVSRTSDGSSVVSIGPVQGRTALVEGLTAYTNYTVEVTAFNTEGGQDLPSPPAQEIVRTAQDAPSRPLNVDSQQQENSCLVSWDRPEHENGIIGSFKVYFTAYPRPGTGLSAEADILNSGSTFVDGIQERYSFNKSDLASFSDFRFKVSATTTTEGANSTEAVGSCTTNAAVPDKPANPVEPKDKGNPVTESTFVLRLSSVNQRNGPISCFEVTVVRLNDNDVISDVDPDILYHPDMLGSFQDAHDKVGTPYVAVVLAGHELSKARDVTIGSSGTSECGSNDSGRRRRQTPRRHDGDNGPLTPSTKYTAFIRAYAVLEDGTEEYVTSDLLQPVYTGNAQADNTVVIVVVCVVGTLVIIILVACGVGLIWRKKKRARNNSRPKRTTIEMDNVDYEVTLAEGGMASTVYEDVGLPSWALRWEILWKNLMVDDKVLGQGNFGEVRSGTVNIGGKRTKTAIKILKGQASKTDREDFMEEFRTMTNIGYHPNVVSLLGACQNEDVLYVSLEYLANGDLRSYLRTARSQSESDEDALSSDQLIKFALDVAKGMKHLSMSGVIHRDLAARNILLGERLVAKVSDFGLSRGEDIYVQTSMRRVPTRWLAIESLLDRTYTTQSDVWSFGILLWEIASIGGTPYPAITTKALANRLMEGYRMTKPTNCDEQIYSLMLRCWEEDPSNRPSFSDLIRILSKMDENKTEQTYMAIDRAHYENFSVIRPELDDN